MTEGAQNTRNTIWAEQLGLSAPIICAPMGGVAGGLLAGAVSAAGGLGMIGMGSAASVTAVDREIAVLDTVMDRRTASFGIGLVAWGIERDPALLDRAIDAGPALVSVSFGEWAGARPSWIDAVQRIGALAVTQIATVDEALAATDAGIDAVIARGLEAGGHGDHQVMRDQLLAQVVSAVEVPVLAAGAIATPDDLTRVLDAGASAAWAGTAFAACEEALTSPRARQQMLAAVGADTVVSRVMDVALDRPWPERFPERMLRTSFIDRWHGHEVALAGDADAKAEFRAAAVAENFDVLPIDVGLGVDHVVEVRPAAAVLAELTRSGAPR